MGGIGEGLLGTPRTTFAPFLQISSYPQVKCVFEREDCHEIVWKQISRPIPGSVVEGGRNCRSSRNGSWKPQRRWQGRSLSERWSFHPEARLSLQLQASHQIFHLRTSATLIPSVTCYSVKEINYFNKEKANEVPIFLYRIGNFVVYPKGARVY